ncbi:MAG: T9SS type A sorting domain-containing protein [Cytophagales bacterium]|nr:T9SS type A sorting domain-containing protein [Cytophagales bacterium]
MMKITHVLKGLVAMAMMIPGLSAQAQPGDSGLELDGAHIILNAEEYHQVFIGIGGSVSFYSQYFSLSDADREAVLRLLAVDLNLKFAKNYVGDLPANDPSEFENSRTYWADLKRHNPDINFQLTVNNLPDHLEGDGEGHDPTIAGVLDSIANYYFKALEYYHNEGLSVLQLDVLNERGLSEKTTDLFDIGIDKLREIINDPAKNPNGVPMPQVCGPSTWSAASPPKWIEDWKQNRPNAWNNVDVVTTHGYQQGTFENYKAIFDVAEGKPFYNNEQTGKIQDDEGTGPNAVDDLARQFVQGEEPDHIGDVSIAMRMSDVINAGGNAFFPFRLTNRNGNNAALVGTRNGTYTPSKIYYGVKHISSIQPDSSYRVGNTSMLTDDYRIVTFRKPGEDTVYVHVTNVWPETRPVKIAVGDGGKAFGIKSVVAWTSNETMEFEEVWNEAFDLSTNAIEFTITPHSVNSFKLAVDPAGFELLKKAQSLTFPPVEDTEVGSSVALNATSDPGLEVKYEVLSGSATIDNGTLTVSGEGEITVRAYQEGNAEYFRAEETIMFCGTPVKPLITREGDVLISSSESNNQWYLAGTPIEGATGQSYDVAEDGIYSVEVEVNDCSSFSDEIRATVIILSIDEELSHQYRIIKNHEGYIEIVSSNDARVEELVIYNLFGQVIGKHEKLDTDRVTIDAPLQPGLYMIRVVDRTGNRKTLKVWTNE